MLRLRRGLIVFTADSEVMTLTVGGFLMSGTYGVGLGDAIAMAEYLVVNESNKGNAKVAVKKFIRRIESRWMQ